MEIFKDLKATVQAWERAFEAMNLGLVLTDQSGVILQVNDTARRILVDANPAGKDLDALLVGALPSKKNIPSFVEAACLESHKEEPSETQIEVETPDHRIVMIKSFCLRIDGVEGSWPSFILGASKDAPQAESLYWESLEKLWESSRSSIEILRAIPSAIFICKIKKGGKLTILDCNPAAEKIASESLAKLQGTPLSDVWHHGGEKDFLRKVAEGNQSNKPFTFEDLHTNPEGVLEKAYKIQVFFMPNDRAGVLFDDITVQKQAERVLEGEIIKLKEIDELKDNFIAVTSHELKTPLVSTCGAAEFLLTNYTSSLGSEELKFVEMINRGATRLKALVNSLLDMSQIQNGQIELAIKDEDLVAALHRVAKDQAYMLETRNQELTIHAPPSLVLPFDAARIEQVLTNIITNAIKNTQQGGRIELRVIKNEEAGEAVVSIVDNGVGITAEEKARLFTRFGKISRDGVKLDLNIQGTGLGLFITKEIVERHGGRIWAESGGRYKGSTFTFLLPIRPPGKAP
ncbi:MAG: PAS domain-containing protein [Candidatus Lokiarchaeota archaeon]|nr:PAS domain-containing protein [Candidatus Lokiarchaeota archaeon]